MNWTAALRWPPLRTLPARDRVLGAVRRRPRLLLALLLSSVALAGALAELRSSWLQSMLAARFAAALHYAIEPGPSPAPTRAPDGPYDQRLGYALLDRMLPRLAARDYPVVAQARPSGALRWLMRWGVPPAYPEKPRAGLRIEDQWGEVLFESLHPRRVFRDFASVPALVLRSLLFIENRELLAPGSDRRNPAVEWDRLARAVVGLAWGGEGRGPGGSTLATQIEKYRHSPGGRTTSAGDKLRQITAATLRGYLGGPETLDARRAIVLSYLNSVPLAAAPGIGEVNGVGDGLWAWFGTDLEQARRLLVEGDPVTDAAARGRVYKQLLSLFVAQRRPSYYLLQGRDDLRRLTDRHLHLLHQAGIIETALRDAALAAPLVFRAPPAVERASFVDTKAADAVRTELLELLGAARFYELDRLDLAVRTTLDRRVGEEVTAALRALADPALAQRAGLRAEGLLARGDPAGVVYSLLLYERTERGNALRVLADTLDRPLNVNEGVKLELGSTAKLRTLVHYLEIVGGLYERYRALPPDALRAEAVHASDRIGRFVLERLRARPETTLPQLLEAALERRYSASPAARFMTGGGLHQFRNYDRRSDERRPTVREAFRDSVNLPFIRLMADIVSHQVFGSSGFAERLLGDADEPWRREYLHRFADLEGRAFLERFFARHRARSAEERRAALVGSRPGSPGRLAALFRALEPQAGPEALAAFLASHAARAVPPDEVRRLHAELDPERFSLHDRAYLARVHPLELWLVGYLRQQPDATLTEVLAAGTSARQDAYAWLFRSRYRSAQDRRIRAVLEREAFAEIHRVWQRHGYPFAELVPSLATAIGVSADRPAALAELVGIVQNGGVRLPLHRVDELSFGSGTPYETRLRRAPQAGERVLRPEVAEAVRTVLLEVVSQGTARRLRGAFRDADAQPLALGGKTGTGDNRQKVFADGGRLVDSRVVNRTASFAFLLGERHFGVITAYVDGPEADAYGFTSSLPLQVLAYLEPILSPLVSGAGHLPEVAPLQLASP